MALFAPRVAAIWSPTGDGRMTVRASYEIFYDSPQLFFDIRVASNPPGGASTTLTDPVVDLSNPWAGVAGGDPFPAIAIFPTGGVYVNTPLHFTPEYLQAWNLSLQRQIGSNLLLSASYLGNDTVHLQAATELDPAINGPGATLANENSRRLLTTINPSQGQYYAMIGQIDPGGVASYNALLVSAQRRLSNGVSALVNWTWSHCLSDPLTTELTGPTWSSIRTLAKAGVCFCGMRSSL